MSTHVHELPHTIELHFLRLDAAKDFDERLALVAYDRQGLREPDGTVNCPGMWFDKNGRAHNRGGFFFRTSKSHGLIGYIHMQPQKAIDMIYRHAAMWSVYTMLGFELSKVDIVDDKDECKITTKDAAFVKFINWTRLWLPKGFYVDDPDDWAYARLNGVSQSRRMRNREKDVKGKIEAETYTKAIYTGFHKVVEKKPEDLFSVKEPELMGKGAWDGTEADEDRLIKKLDMMMNKKLGIEDSETTPDDMKSRWGDYARY